MGAVHHYEVWRQGPTPLGTFVIWAANVTGTSYTDSVFSAATAYVYKAVAISATLIRSTDSNRDLAYTALFLDDPLVANSTLVKYQHITQLRQAVVAVRLTGGLGITPNPPWTDSSLTAGTLVRAPHIMDLRLNLDPALAALGVSTDLPPPPYTDGQLYVLVTAVRYQHVQELRDRIK